MSHRSKGLKWSGRTLPDSNRLKFACRFWRNCDRAIESNELTTIEGSPPIVGKSFRADPCASPPLGGGVLARKGFSMNINGMQW